eukprot:1314740-Amorphochlora_amoeboformis.AAC.1
METGKRTAMFGEIPRGLFHTLHLIFRISVFRERRESKVEMRVERARKRIWRIHRERKDFLRASDPKEERSTMRENNKNNTKRI